MFVIPAGTAAIVTRAGEASADRLTVPLELARMPEGRGLWLTIATADGSVQVPRSAVRLVVRERARLDTHGWRDGDDD